MISRLGKPCNIHARNFIHQEAQKRLYEVVQAAQEISTHSVFVHATKITYYAQVVNDLKCSCREKVLTDELLPHAPPGTAENNISIDFSTPLFGKISAGEKIREERDIARYDSDLNSQQLVTSSLFGNATDCPICCRAGTLPGFQPVGYSRLVFTTNNSVDAAGYSVDSSSSVSKLVSDRNDSWVLYQLDIPYLFTAVQFAVYHLTTVLDTELWINEDELVTLDTLNRYRGKTIELKVRGVTFTHCVFQFKLNSQQLLADFPQDSQPKDYSLFDTTPPVTIVMDRSVPVLTVGDIIYKHQYRTFWRVTDFEFFRMKTQTVIGWSLNAKLIQQDEIVPMLRNFGS